MYPQNIPKVAAVRKASLCAGQAITNVHMVTDIIPFRHLDIARLLRFTYKCLVNCSFELYILVEQYAKVHLQNHCNCIFESYTH